jgi:hypothetical protein
MNRQTLEQPLARADRTLSKGGEPVDRQPRIVADPEHEGHDIAARRAVVRAAGRL